MLRVNYPVRYGSTGSRRAKVGATVNNKVYRWNTGKGERVARNHRYASIARKNLANGGEPAKGSSKRHDVTGKDSDCRELLPQGETECVNLCTRHHPVEHSHRNDDVSRGEMKGVCVRIRDSKAIGHTYAL